MGLFYAYTFYAILNTMNTYIKKARDMRFSYKIGKLKISVLGRLAKITYDEKPLFIKCGHKFMLTNRDL